MDTSAAERSVERSPSDAVTAERLVSIAERVATSVRAGGRLLVEGRGRGAADARHVVVEFMHPVTVGKRALPCFEGFADRRPDDVTMSIAYGGPAPHDDVDITFTDRPPERVGDPEGHADDGPIMLPLPPNDPGAAKVTAVLGYHVMWELVHVFLESSSTAESTAPSASALYPMLYETPQQASTADRRRLAAVRSAAAKLAESRAVRTATVAVNVDELQRAAEYLAAARAVFTLGNGGSATDAVDAAVTFGISARSLTDDVATITALANDVSFDVVFARQLATVGRAGDCVVAFSTSGNSPNVIQAATAARRIGMRTIGFAGYDGGAMASSQVFDVLMVVDSDSVHRIQEAHSELVAQLATV